MSTEQKTIFDFRVKDIDGNEFDLTRHRGKKILIVNVASECGLTPQYSELELLYQKYKDHDFTIIAFPSNDFHKQEPGTNKEIKRFCEKTYKITFPLMSKVSVTGAEMIPLFEWLTTKEENGKMNVNIEWNFQKFLIDESGNLVDIVVPFVSPLCHKIINWIERGHL